MKMQLRVWLVLGAVTAGLTASSPAQARDLARPHIAPGTMIQPAKTFDEMLTGFEKEFVGAAGAMPAETYNFAPSAAIFAPGRKAEYAGVKTFAEQVKHVAQDNYAFGRAIGGLAVDTDVKAIGSLKGKDEIMAALTASFVFAHKALANLTEKNAFESVQENETRSSLAGGLVAHGYDHYGQMVEYLRMNAIIPPASRR